jgi:hypothetical protein
VCFCPFFVQALTFDINGEILISSSAEQLCPAM